MKLTVADLKSVVDQSFKTHSVVKSLWQTLSEHFYPERADFTVTHNVGQELADNLVDSYPILVRRDLGNSLSAMLRDGNWFDVTINGNPDHSGAMWLQWATQRLRQLIKDRVSNFIRATKEGDHDYVTFGNAVLSVEVNRKMDGLLYRCWHLRDCAWWDDENGQVGGVVRKWKPTRRQLVDFFGKDKVHPDIVKDLHNNNFKMVDIVHLNIPSRMYGDEEIEARFPWVSIYLDVENEHLIEVVGQRSRQYVVPRFHTIPGSPYAYSPATVVGLPDARCLQAMTHTLLEAGERYARPPIIATQKVVRGDVDLAPDGITWVDKEYDEKLGAALRPLSQDRGGFPIGLEMRNNIVEILSSAFYRDKLTILPDVNRDVTAYEYSERMKQYRRENLPLFSPIESEYNGQLCELSFDLAMDAGFLGSPYDIPESLRGGDVVFKFQSPLTVSEEEEKITRFSIINKMLGEAVAYDPNIGMNIDFDEALRDAASGAGTPEKWFTSPEQVEQGRQAAMMQQIAAAAGEME